MFLIMMVLIIAVIYLDCLINLPQALSLEIFLRMNTGEMLIAAGILYLPFILGLYAVISRSMFATSVFAGVMLSLCFLPTIKPLEAILMCFFLLWFVELNYAWVKLCRSPILLKSYLSHSIPLLLPVVLLAVFTLKLNSLLSVFDPRFGESVELGSIYGIFIATVVFFCIVAAVLFAKK